VYVWTLFSFIILLLHFCSQYSFFVSPFSLVLSFSFFSQFLFFIHHLSKFCSQFSFLILLLHFYFLFLS
jgi:hypothetical protein